MKVKTIATVTVSTLILAFASISSAQEGDITTHPASLCKISSSAISSNDYRFINFNGSLFNLSAEPLVVICPLVADLLADSDVATTTIPWMQVRDVSSQNFECAFNGTNFSSPQNSSGASNTPQDIVFEAYPEPTPASYSDNSTMIYCSIPPVNTEGEASGIFLYSADERIYE